MNRPRTAGHPGPLPPSLTTSSEGNTITDRYITANQAPLTDPSYDDDDDDDDDDDADNDDDNCIMMNVIVIVVMMITMTIH